MRTIKSAVATIAVAVFALPIGAQDSEKVDFVELMREPEKYLGEHISFDARYMQGIDFTGFIPPNDEISLGALCPYFSAEVRTLPDGPKPPNFEQGVYPVSVEGELIRLNKNEDGNGIVLTSGGCYNDFRIKNPLIKRL